MKDKVLIIVFLLISFAVSFIFTTILTDAWCHSNGFYDEGIKAEQRLYQ